MLSQYVLSPEGSEGFVLMYMLMLLMVIVGYDDDDVDDDVVDVDF